MTLEQKREIISKLGNFELITNYYPNVWKNEKNIKITSISFDKPKMFSHLLSIVDTLEQEYNLSIEIKRHTCIIKKQYLNRHETIANIDGVNKQGAVFLALVELSKYLNNKQNEILN